jgi:putative CocE/NonD family hydrolase
MTTLSEESIRRPAGSLYEEDFYTWLTTTAHRLRHGRLDRADLELVAEELEDMGRSERHAVASRLAMLLQHLLKWQHQPTDCGGPMKTVTDLPRRVRVLEHVRIPMPDGVQLSARVWIPEGAEQDPVPAVLEYIPYRKRDLTRCRDEQTYGYFGGHGYAGVRVDLRGTGESEGVLTDEYLPQELADGVEVLRWIAAQPWCDGTVGMMGISWGGFNALQIAALQPPELKAIITVCSTDDRYADDVHYMGGCLLGDNLSWAATMFARNAKPPDPKLVGERWRELWLERLAHSGHWLVDWLAHQHRDDYWRHGSICEDFSAVRVPVLAASGWADGYSNAVFRLLASLEVPRQGLIGPWSHKYPHLGLPGPAIGFLQEAVRWWDRWLKGMDNGVEDEPMLRAWMQASMPPTASYKVRPGRWVAEGEWPSPRIQERVYPLAPGRVFRPDRAPVDKRRTLRSPLSVGLFAGKWCSYSATPDLPHDQRQEDGGALVFDSAPLPETLEILGAPVVDLDLSSDQPVAMVAVRLSDVAPDDKATRVTYGLLNLTHRDGHQHPQPLEPGRRYAVQVQLNDVAQVFPKGHRLRVAISTSYFPLAWPPPAPVRLTVHTLNSRLRLPVRPPDPADADLRPFGESEGAPCCEKRIIEPTHATWRVIRDLATDRSTLEVVKDDGCYRLDDIDLEVRAKTLEWYGFQGDDFHSARGETYWEVTFERGEWTARTVTRSILTSDATHFRLQATLDAYEGDSRVFSKSWDERIARRLV